jgi:hypothetical protein
LATVAGSKFHYGVSRDWYRNSLNERTIRNTDKYTVKNWRLQAIDG